MSLAGFMKQVTKTSQFLSEKVGGAVGSEIDSDVIELGRKLDAVNVCVDNMQGRTKEYLQPNPSARAKLALQSNYQKATGQATTAAATKYPQVEYSLGESFAKLGSSLKGETPYPSALLELGKAFIHLSEAKDQMETRVKQNFLDPLYEVQQKDLKEIAYHRKKLEGRRLDYDFKKGRAGKVTPEELQAAEDKFETSKEICYTSMTNYLESEEEHILQLHEFSTAIRDYHEQCTRILETVTNTLSEKLGQAAALPREERKTFDRESNFNKSIESFEVINDGKDSVGPSAPALAPAPAPARTNQQQPSCRAVYDFEPENEGELSFYEGDMIEIMSRLDDSWLEGRCNGREGYFPENYVEIIVPI